MEQSLKQYFNECLVAMPEYDNESWKERLELDYITIALLKLSMKYS